MTERKRISTGTTWEAIAGYSRAIKTGSSIQVSGTTATDEQGDVVGLNDPYTQTIYIIRKIERALKEAGATLNDVVRTRLYIVNKDDWEIVSRAHGEIFGDIRPANTLIVIQAIIGDGYLVEMEADAIVGIES